MREENVAAEEDKSYCVYVHTNKINGKKYVGQTKANPPQKRWYNGNGYKDCTYFYNAIKKYGWENFEHEIIKSNLTLDEANELETLLIKEYDTMNPKKGYNLQSGGHNYEFSEEALKNISIAQKKRFESPEERKKLGKRMKGKHHSQETKEKMKNAHLNLIQQNAMQTDQYSVDGKFIKTWRSRRYAAAYLGIRVEHIFECCKGLRKTAGGYIWRNHGEELTNEHLKWCTTHENAKSVMQFSKKDGNLLKIWDSLSDVERELGISTSHISQCCNGNRMSSFGYIWMYYDDYYEDEELSKKRIEEIVNHKRYVSDETKKKIGYANRCSKSKEVSQYSRDGDFIKSWYCASDASRELNIRVSHIRECCLNQRKSAGGYIWRNKNEPLTKEYLEWCNSHGNKKQNNN